MTVTHNDQGFVVIKTGQVFDIELTADAAMQEAAILEGLAEKFSKIIHKQTGFAGTAKEALILAQDLRSHAREARRLWMTA